MRAWGAPAAASIGADEDSGYSRRNGEGCGVKTEEEKGGESAGYLLTIEGDGWKWKPHTTGTSDGEEEIGKYY